MSLIIFSPGRINLIGEHIDYNGGFVLPAAIDKHVIVDIDLSETSLCHVSSEQTGSFKFDISIQIDKSDTLWHNYILGVVAGIKKLRPAWQKGFIAKISSNLPVGSGISSSAALECGLAQAINELFELNLTKMEIINLAHSAEHDYVGTKCGIMDQFSVMMGKKNQLMLLNCDTLEHDYINAVFDPYVIILLNSNVAHELASSEYNLRRAACESTLKIINKEYPDYKKLAEVPLKVLEAVKDDLTITQYKRASYVIEEQARTIKAADAIKKGEIKLFGKLMYASHEGLSNKYDVSSDELDFMVDFSKDYPEVVGSRLMGGGFGGCTINLVKSDEVANYLADLSEAYSQRFSKSLTPIFVEVSEGVRANSSKTVV